MLKITSVTIYPFEPESTPKLQTSLLAYADVVLNKKLTIKGFKVFRSKSGGLFISFPAQRSKSGSWYDLVVPLEKELTNYFRAEIVNAYKEYK